MKIDFPDLESLIGLTIKTNRQGYAYVYKDKKVHLIHRLIMDPPKGMDVDHINGDVTDNRRKNLRLCTRSENQMNRKIRQDNTSGYPGVGRKKGRNVWGAGIKLNGKKIHLGYFKTLREAIIARREAEIKYFGEFRKKKISLKVYRI